MFAFVKSYPCSWSFCRTILIAGLATVLNCTGCAAEAETPAISVLLAEADGGSPEALFKLGRAYERGEGVERDLQRALELYRKAADQGYGKAQHNLGAMYANGRGVEKDATTAVEWLRKAADQGLTLSQMALASILKRGSGVKKDVPQAAEWYGRAAALGDIQAAWELGRLYLFGDDGFPVDFTKALPWIKQAAERGFAPAQNALGVMFENGSGLPADCASAAKWFRLAADQGDAKGQSNLGRLYSVGQGVTRDVAEAYAWLKLSAAQNEVTATKLLEDLESGLPESVSQEGSRRQAQYEASIAKAAAARQP